MKKQRTIMVDEDVWQAMLVWIGEQIAPPSQSSVVEASIRRFLDEHANPQKRRSSK